MTQPPPLTDDIVPELVAAWVALRYEDELAEVSAKWLNKRVVVGGRRGLVIGFRLDGGGCKAVVRLDGNRGLTLCEPETVKGEALQDFASFVAGDKGVEVVSIAGKTARLVRADAGQAAYFLDLGVVTAHDTGRDSITVDFCVGELTGLRRSQLTVVE